MERGGTGRLLSRINFISSSMMYSVSVQLYQLFSVLCAWGFSGNLGVLFRSTPGYTQDTQGRDTAMPRQGFC